MSSLRDPRPVPAAFSSGCPKGLNPANRWPNSLEVEQRRCDNDPRNVSPSRLTSGDCFMGSPRPPWWLYVVASSYVFYFLLFAFVDFRGPQPWGAWFQNDYRCQGVIA